jgi:uncharacterized protein YlxW (UPF0749 family)
MTTTTPSGSAPEPLDLLVAEVRATAAESRALAAEVRAERATVDAYRSEVKAIAESLSIRFDELDREVAAIARRLMEGGS